MTVRVYRSSDASAPTLSGTSDALIGVLDGCLVTGYGSQTAAGWTKPFTGTNTATFLQGTGSNFQYYLHINDNSPGAGTGKEARVFGSEQATAVLTGTNLFPTTAQAVNGLFVRKSNTADSTVRPWIVVADERTFYMFVLTGDVVGNYAGWCFGDIFSLKSGDFGRCYIAARPTENIATFNLNELDGQNTHTTNMTAAYLNRDAQGSINPNAAGRYGDLSLTTYAGASITLSGTVGFTNAADNQIYVAPVHVTRFDSSSLSAVRGRLRGFWHWCHPVGSAADGDTFSGSGALAGKTFLIIKLSGNGGLYVMETSNTWETN